MTTILHKCTCKHAFQDSAYGVGVRVHNPVPDATKKVFRCTVCSHEVSTSKDDKKADKKAEAEAAESTKGKKGKKAAA